MANTENPGTAGRMEREAVRDDVGALKGDLASLRSDIGNLSRDAVVVAKSGLGAAKDRAQSAMETAMDRGRENVKSLERQIQDRPLAAVGIALGVGVLIGSLLRR